jgi:hypothetical protein
VIGAICKRDILAHPVVTIRCFGWKVFFRALVADQHQTFLSLLAEANALFPAEEKVPRLVDRCIGLELCAERVYRSLARRFDHAESARRFFETLAHQERNHAELLELCRAAAARGDWDGRHFDPWRDAVPALEKQMQELESRAGCLESLSDALGLVVQIESSEVNDIYLGIVTASDSDFVRRLRVFREAGLNHISYILERIPEMEPELRDACQELGGACSRTLARA